MPVHDSCAAQHMPAGHPCSAPWVRRVGVVSQRVLWISLYQQRRWRSRMPEFRGFRRIRGFCHSTDVAKHSHYRESRKASRQVGGLHPTHRSSALAVEGVLMSSTLGEPAPATPLLGAAGLGVLLEAMPDALVGADRAGVICLINHHAAARLGYD